MTTNVETSFLVTVSAPNLEVHQHNLATDKRGEDAFGLGHALACTPAHPQRQRAVERIVITAKPGGWLVVEDRNARVRQIVRTTKSLPASQKQAGWSRLQMAYLSVSDNEVREAMRSVSD